MNRFSTKTIPIAYDPHKNVWLSMKSTSPFSKKVQLGQSRSLELLPYSLESGRSDQMIALFLRSKQQNQQIELGPVIGILASKQGKAFRGNSENFKDLILIGHQLGALVYVFTPYDWNEATGIVQGYTYHPNAGKWVTGRFPIPHVVYNRVPYREHEQVQQTQTLIKWLLDHPHISIFNPSFFDKQELFNRIQSDPSVKAFLPETIPLNHKQALMDMMSRYSMVYLKPVNGKAGSGIMRLEKSILGNWNLIRQKNISSEATSCKNLHEVWEQIAQEVRSTPYLVQKGIRLSSSNGRPFDLRALLQKDGTGKWSITGVGARIAGANSITTHVPRGGMIGNPLLLLKEQHGRNTVTIMQYLKKAALRLAEAIERGGSYPLGEMSMDLAIDERGRPWFLEANAKPMKFDEPHIRKKSLERIIEYAAYLSGFAEGAGA